MQYNCIDKFVYHIKEMSAYECEDGYLRMAPMEKATFRDVIFAIMKLVFLTISLAFWLPGILGIFFIGPFNWVHSAIYVASVAAVGFVINNWEVKYVQDYQRERG